MKRAATSFFPVQRHADLPFAPVARPCLIGPSLGAWLALATLSASLTGCNVLAFAGMAAENYKRSSTHAVAPEYDNLRGESVAVIVTGDRVLQGSHPTLFTRMSSRATERLVENKDLIGITGFVPPLALTEFQISHPNWVAWGYDRLAEELGVKRLIVIEMFDYRLTEVGNQYLWDAVAAARVGVIEADGFSPGEFVFRKEIQVHFPDQTGVGPEDLSAQQVQANLDKRFIDRVTWLFYEHQEPYYPDY
ncbi:MAG: hypothetical protein JNK58_02645 [Phycisphaerae bacterium]|nr:hypothetical protein [Phycisphaerae bacterium]